MVNKSREALERAAANVGGFPILAKKLGITRHALYQWSVVPSNRVIAIEAATGVSRDELRPDLYPSTNEAAA